MKGRVFDGHRLRAVRQAGGVRMIELARAANCSYAHLRMSERSDRQISTELAYRFARALTSLIGRPVSIDEFSEIGDPKDKKAA